MNKPLLIFGAGAHAREVHQVIQDVNAVAGNRERWSMQAFVVDAFYRIATELRGLPVITLEECAGRFPDAWHIVAIGQPAHRWRATQRLDALGVKQFATLVHPNAWVADRSSLGTGCVVMAGCQVNTDCHIGSHVHLNLGSTVSHDCHVGDHTSLGPGTHLAGGVTFGPGVDAGVGCIAMPGVIVGEWSTLGAGAVVTQSIRPNSTAVGVPAREIASREPGWQQEDHPASA